MLEIRLLEETDSFAELTDLLHRAYAPLKEMGLRYLATHQDESVTKERCLSGETYLAILDGLIVATITFRTADQTSGCDWYDRPEVSGFGQFAVESALKGQGIGRALMDHVEERARNTGALEIAPDTAQPARHLIDYYLRRGYRYIETVDWKETNYLSVVMSKRLGA